MKQIVIARGGSGFLSGSELRSITYLSVAYAQDDKKVFSRFMDHVKPLLRNDLLIPWVDFSIRDFMEPKPEVVAALDAPQQIIVSLLTPDYLKYEVPLEYKCKIHHFAKEKNPADHVVVPVLVKDALWEEEDPFCRIKRLPVNGRPIFSEPFIDDHTDYEFVQVAREIAKIVRKMRGSSEGRRATLGRQENLNRAKLLPAGTGASSRNSSAKLTGTCRATLTINAELSSTLLHDGPVESSVAR